ncbi:metalloproteinase inhibitor 4-like isoform X2 [Tachypleus tridentatus]|uniref:metalloproteinase inhibitor 4-like isoform X2 n=1 Tax=Tachypleus tridentatus TaxID=6853 RepID=UPI003FD178BF
MVLAKVNSSGKSNEHYISYDIRLKKEFKMTKKARQALSHGLIWTAKHDSLCGVSLSRTKYVITGDVNGEKPWLSLCNYFKQWSHLSIKQRKGFRRLYQHGCGCRIIFSRHMVWQGLAPDGQRYCPWQTSREKIRDCQGLHSVCIQDPKQNSTCKWLPNRTFKRCVKRLEREKQKEP